MTRMEHSSTPKKRIVAAKPAPTIRAIFDRIIAPLARWLSSSQPSACLLRFHILPDRLIDEFGHLSQSLFLEVGLVHKTVPAVLEVCLDVNHGHAHLLARFQGCLVIFVREVFPPPR